ncbi:MAG: hypothetical protein HC875_31110, partial [Anaerolineales bacterium]|nr:hypothetical protein [Anaerolineales bacterium]
MTINALPENLKINSRLRSHLLLLLVYFLLAAALTWPTLSHLTTHLPGDGGDDPAIAWNFWWLKHALLTLAQNPFQSDFLFYPLGINLAFYTLTVLNAVIALPLTLNLGVIAASNLHTLFTFVSGGYGAFLLTRYVLTTADPLKGRGASPLLPRPPAPLLFFSTALASGFYAFASSKLFYVALGQFNIASSHWIPWAVLYILRMQRHPRQLKNAVIAGLFFTLQAWSELTYASFLAVFIALYWIYDFAVRAFGGFTIYDLRFKDISSNKSSLPAIYYQLSTVLILLLLILLGLSPILAQMLPDMQAEGDFLVEGSGFADAFSADALGFVIPTLHHPWLGQLIHQTNIQAFDKGQHIFVGFVLLGLLLIALPTGYRRPELRFWLIASAVFGLLCLGPIITVDGYATGLPGPFSLLQQLPFFKGNRYPSRYSVMLLLSLSVVAAFALVQLSQWANHQWSIINNQRSTTPNPSTIHYPLFAVILFLFLFEHLSTPLPQSDMRVPPAYQTIAAAPGDFTVLDIPFAWRNGFRITGALTTQFMFGQFYQTTHQKRLLQGNTSRNPAFKFQYFTDAPVIDSLLALETGHPLPPEQQGTDRAIAAEVLAFFNIKYIVVRPYQYDTFDGQQNITVTEQAVIPYIESVLPVEKIHDEAAIKIYRVTSVEESERKANLQIDSASPLAPLYFGEGWGLLTPGQSITAQRQAVRLLLPLTGDAQRITLRLRLPEGIGTLVQSLSLELNGWQSPTQAVSADWQELIFELPAGVARPGLNDVWLHFAGTTPIQTPQITVLSAGEEVGDFGHIFVNGRDVSPNQRGYNVAIIQPDGTLHTANFDTHLDPAASAALTRLLASSPPEAFLALAAADEASAHLSEEAVHALQTLGAAADLRGCFRCSHAFIRTPSGQTFEAFDALHPVGVTTGLGLTEPQVAAEVEWI